MDRLDTINNTLTTQWNRLQSIRNTVDDTGAQADRARSRVQDAESLIDRARQELDKAKDALSKVVSRVSVVMGTFPVGGMIIAEAVCRTSSPPLEQESPTT